LAVTVRTQERTPIWRDATVLKWAAQITLLIAVGIIFVTLFNQAQANLEARGITYSTKFLSDPPGISIREGISLQPETGARALYTGLVNTLRVSISGIIAATIIGTLIGISRLSGNWIVSKLATVYIETIRNIPLLVQIFFWLAVSQVFTKIDELEVGKYWFLVTARGISPPWLFPADGFYHWLVFLAVGAVAGYLVHRYYLNKQLREGGETYAYTKGIAVVVVIAVVGWFIHPVVSFVGALWDAISSFFGAIPTGVLQALLAAAAVGLAALWIKRFLDNLRTPAGLAKLTDDDWFRMIFVGLAGLGFAALFIFAGQIAETTLNMAEAFFNFLGNKYDSAFTGDPFRFARPAVEVRGTGGFTQLSNDGLVITPGFFALWVGVTLYTAAFIAEIVRGGILAVSKGQSEAGGALGLTRFQLLRFIVLPQAFRIILPPMGNQYLNLFKNTSLGIAVAFPDIVQVGQTLYNQTGMTFPIVLMWMAFFLSGSLVLSSIVNYWNRRLKLVER
jgi:general L-amino acid transport system permease protein